MSIGRVFNRAFATIGANPLTMFGISFLFGALPSVVLKALLQSPRATQTLPFSSTALLLTAGVALLTLAFNFLAQGALVVPQLLLVFYCLEAMKNPPNPPKE